MVVSTVWCLTRRPTGIPVNEDFTCKEEELPPCKEGEVITEAEFLSVDPYMRYMARDLPLNSVMIGAALCRVIESKNAHWPVGSYFICNTGWRTHALIAKDTLNSRASLSGIQPLPDMKHLSKSLCLGSVGHTGATAYFGFLEICKPKAGETVVVNAAAGATGSIVVQIAKLKGCKVIAFAGSDEKVAYCKEIGADHAFNYKKVQIGEVLQKVAPEKIQCYFENVGGKFTAEVLPHMADFGRVSLCGIISTYNEEKKDTGELPMTSPWNEATILWKQLRVEGFLLTRWDGKHHEALIQLNQWALEGKIKHRETIFEGFDKMPEAFIGLFTGENIGKTIIKV